MIEKYDVEIRISIVIGMALLLAALSYASARANNAALLILCILGWLALIILLLIPIREDDLK